MQQRFEPLAAFERAQLAQVLAGSICAGELIAAEAALFVGAVSAFMRPPQLCSDALLVDRQVAYFDLAGNRPCRCDVARRQLGVAFARIAQSHGTPALHASPHSGLTRASDLKGISGMGT